jgi:hypothetical protein
MKNSQKVNNFSKHRFSFDIVMKILDVEFIGDECCTDREQYDRKALILC